MSIMDANKSKSHVPDVMLGALSKREQETFFKKKIGGDESDGDTKINTGGYDSLDNEEHGQISWEHNINLEKERASLLNVLS